MIEWIKFKGSTEEERRKEIKIPFIAWDKGIGFYHEMVDLGGWSTYEKYPLVPS